MAKKQVVPVSVVIPCYRGHRTLERAVDSVMAGTALPLEIIIVNDFSNDEGVTEAKLKEIKDKRGEIVKLLSHTENKGLGATRNTGWDAAKGEYVAFLDDDDIWHPEKLAIQYEFMKSHPEADILGAKMEWLRSSEIFKQTERIKFIRLPKYTFLLKNPFSTCSSVIKRKIPERFPEIRRVEDYYFWLTIYKKYRFYLCLQPLCFMLKPPFGANGLGADVDVMHRANLEVFNKLKKQKTISFFDYIALLYFEKIKLYIRKFRAKKYRKLYT